MLTKFNELTEAEHVVLFDMDGTLTEPRKKIRQNMVRALRDLSDYAYIGVVSGSPMIYIQEQISKAWDDIATVPGSKLMILPCNGTQTYCFKQGCLNFKLTYKASLLEHLGTICAAPEPYRELVSNLIELQSYSMRKYDHPVTGNFVSYRESLLNWCMIGRDASHEDRATFIIEDAEKDLRKHLCECLRVRLDASDLHEIDLVLGGSTSIDIYPKGWDKTYALRHLGDATVWFAGDKCAPGGNDFTLYDRLEPTGRAKHVSSPEETISWIKNTVIPQIKDEA